jgi:hypothetical protein
MAGALKAIDLVGGGIKHLAKALDIPISKENEPYFTPVSTATSYLTNKAEEALGVPKDTISAATNLKGFASNVLKDTAKDYFRDKGEIPEEDRSFVSNNTKSELSDTYADNDIEAFKRGGKVKSAAKSKVSTASRRGDGIAQRGKTKGRYL